MKKEKMPHCQTDAAASEIPFTAAASVLFLCRRPGSLSCFQGAKTFFKQVRGTFHISVCGIWDKRYVVIRTGKMKRCAFWFLFFRAEALKKHFV